MTGSRADWPRYVASSMPSRWGLPEGRVGADDYAAVVDLWKPYVAAFLTTPKVDPRLGIDVGEAWDALAQKAAQRPASYLWTKLDRQDWDRRRRAIWDHWAKSVPRPVWDVRGLGPPGATRSLVGRRWPRYVATDDASAWGVGHANQRAVVDLSGFRVVLGREATAPDLDSTDWDWDWVAKDVAANPDLYVWVDPDLSFVFAERRQRLWDSWAKFGAWGQADVRGVGPVEVPPPSHMLDTLAGEAEPEAGTDDAVNAPSHYVVEGLPECAEVIERLGLPWHVGNALKYAWRLGRKDMTVEGRAIDARKAAWYMLRHAHVLEAERDGRDPDPPKTTRVGGPSRWGLPEGRADDGDE